MKYRPLGRTGLQVSTLCLGTAFLGSFTGLEESIKIVGRAMDLGVSFFDAANTYGDRRFSVAIAPKDRPMVEQIAGQALRGHTAAQEALAWVLGHPAVTAAVMGASSVAQLEANVAAFDLEFSAEEREELAKARPSRQPRAGSSPWRSSGRTGSPASSARRTSSTSAASWRAAASRSSPGTAAATTSARFSGPGMERQDSAAAAGRRSTSARGTSPPGWASRWAWAFAESPCSGTAWGR